MKLTCLNLAFFFISIISFSQNVGVGTSNPKEKLDVDGAIRIGTTAEINAGTIRFESGQFEGHDGASWKAFTSLPAGTLVASATNPNAALISAGFSYFSQVYVNKSATLTTTADSWLDNQLFNAPEGRSGHVAAWGGSKMFVWGGGNAVPFNTGGLYDPITDTWTATSASPLTARFLPSVIWTGTVFIVWGGSDFAGVFFGDGATYNPSTNTWAFISSVNAPSARYNHTAVWTGTQMIIWGGYSSSGKENSGGIYNPSTNTWTATSTASAPGGRYFHSAVWTGTQMIVWGGENTSDVRVNDGGLYNPSTNTWTSTTLTNAPVARWTHTAIWTGTEMVIWGGEDPGIGFYNTGGKYNPSTNTWIATSTSGSPTIRASHRAIWTGSQMIVWGGLGPGSSNFTFYNNGGKYNPATNTWSTMSISNTPSGRSAHSAVWTGNQMIVWGGYDGTGTAFDDGGRYIVNSESNITVLTPSVLYLYMKN